MLETMGYLCLGDLLTDPVSLPAIVVDPVSTELMSIDGGPVPLKHKYNVYTQDTPGHHNGSIAETRLFVVGLLVDCLTRINPLNVGDIDLFEDVTGNIPVCVASSQITVGAQSEHSQE